MNKKELKKTILVDLDGVLNEYNGYYAEDIIPPIKRGAKTFLQELSIIFKIVIFTTRPIKLTYEWLVKNNIDKYIFDVTNIKIPAFLIIDDRAICFKGNYSETLNDIADFSVHWNN